MQAVFSLSASGRETDITMRTSKLRSSSCRSNTPSPSWISGFVHDGRYVRMVETISTRQLNDSLRVLLAQIQFQCFDRVVNVPVAIRQERSVARMCFSGRVPKEHCGRPYSVATTSACGSEVQKPVDVPQVKYTQDLDDCFHRREHSIQLSSSRLPLHAFLSCLILLRTEQYVFRSSNEVRFVGPCQGTGGSFGF